MKLVPYKIMVILLYGDLDFIARGAPGWVTVQTNKLAHHLHMPNSTLKGFMAELSRLGLLQELQVVHGAFTAKLRQPAGAAWTICGQDSYVKEGCGGVV